MNTKTKLVLSALCSGIAGLLPTFVLAADSSTLVNFSFGDQFLLGSASPVDIAIAMINWTLAILALLALGVMLWGGMTWLLSQGEEEKIEHAKAILRNGIIGLVIVLASWGIVTYIINALLDLTNATDSSSQGGTPPLGGTGTGPTLSIDHTNPSDLQTDVSLCYAIAFTFSDQLITDTVNAETIKTTISGGLDENTTCTEGSQCKSGVCTERLCVGSQLPGTFGFSEDNQKVAVFYPASDYYANTKYHVEVKTGTDGVNGIDAQSQAKIHLVNNASHSVFDFTTGTTTDDIPPTVDVVRFTPYPDDESTDICLNPTIQTTFSESIDPISPRDSNVWLYAFDDKIEPPMVPVDQLDVKDIDMNSLVVTDDTIDTGPENQLAPNSSYGLNLYSGVDGKKNTGDTNTWAITDMCGNPLSGDFDTIAEGSPIDDFVDPASSGAEHGYDYQWTWTTGEEVYCTPYIESIQPDSVYYSEDLGADTYTDQVTLTGKYLYPFIDVLFTDDILAADGKKCFDSTFKTEAMCFIGHESSTAITIRTPVGSETGGVTVSNETGSDTSKNLRVDSPIIHYTSPKEGGVGQYVTIKGNQFGSSKGKVFFDTIEAEVACGADGWDDREIIAIVPAGLTRTNPDIQIVTAASNVAAPDKHSNSIMFTVTEDPPGPGLCELNPNCSDTGKDDIAATGEHLGIDPGSVWFDGVKTTEEYIPGEIYSETWTDTNFTTNKTPVTALDTYDFVAEDSDDVRSNGLDFKISCTPPPAVYENNSCDLDKTVYIPNPQNNEKNACVNNDIYFAFNSNMTKIDVTGQVKIYGCNSEDSFNDTTCTDTIYGSLKYDGTLGMDYPGSTGTNYDAFKFNPGTNLTAKRWYQVVVPSTINNTAGVPLVEAYTWHFRVRDSNEPCDADALLLEPGYQRITSYNPAATCLLNYEGEYTFEATPLTVECLLLDNLDGEYDWKINVDNIIQFSPGTPAPSDPMNDQLSVTTGGYNTVCLQGDDAINMGQAQVTATLKEVFNDATVDVDYGYCESDSDCYTASCQNTHCDAASSHCTPDITGFAPNYDQDDDLSNDDTPDVGKGGCLTINGCYFGPDRVSNEACTCTSAANLNQSCEIAFGGTQCMLSRDSTYCTLGEQLCTLSNGGVCSENSETKQYSDVYQGVITGCTCTIATQECSVSVGSSTCVIPGTETCTDSSATYVKPATGKVTLDQDSTHVDSSYPDANNCPDVWSDHQIIVQVPTDDTFNAGDYGITVQSFYTDKDGNHLAGSSTETCSIGADRTACLCLADPNVANEQATTDLYGEGFDILENSGKETVSFAVNNPDGKYTGNRIDSTGKDNVNSSDNKLQSVQVPPGATGDTSYGVQAQNDSSENNPTRVSNPIDFTVSCGANSDCATGCCSQGRCSDAQACNTCAADTDCSYNSCNSKCSAGICEPYITSISPNVGAEGQPVTINGCHFGSYYKQGDYSPYSKVTIDTPDNVVEAPLACSTLEAWNNEHIIVTMPTGTFAEGKDTANVVVTQVSTISTDQVAQTTTNSDHSVFTKDNSCSQVSIPVLCTLEPAYGPLTTDTTLTGEHFYPTKAGYCSCATETLGVCEVEEDSPTSSCTVESKKRYSIPEKCSDGSNPDFPATTSSATVHAVWDDNLDIDGDGTADGGCVYTDPNTSYTCNIAVDETSCPVETEKCTLQDIYYVNTDAIDEKCSVDSKSYDAALPGCAADSDDVDTCTIAINETSCTKQINCDASADSYVQLSGSVDFTYGVQAEMNWGAYVNDTTYITDVPDTAETGDVVAKATTDDNIQCVSNGQEFAVSCSSCGECKYNPDVSMNCDLTYNPDDPADMYDSAFGACTTKSTGFCRTAPSSCCNNTSCVYDDTTSDANGNYDGGTCAQQPILTVDSHTNPDPNDSSICLNAELKLEFSQPITTDVAFDTLNVYDADGNLLPSTAPDFKGYVTLVNTGDATDILDSVTLGDDGKTLTLHQSKLLDYDTTYKISIATHNTVVNDTSRQGGVVSVADGVAVSHTGTEGTSYSGDYLSYTFTTVLDEAAFKEQCTPSSIVLEAVDQDFIDVGYTFTTAEQTEGFAATVYASGTDGTPDNGLDDDQPVTRLSGAYDWTYDWEKVYGSVDELENTQCGAGAIISGGEDSGFIEDQAQQTVTAGNKDNTDDSVSVNITADANNGDGWTGTLGPVIKNFHVVFCSNADNVVRYTNGDYNFGWAYCRDNNVPKFEEIFTRNTKDEASDNYDQSTQFIYEVAFKDVTATISENDPTGNNNIIALRIYPNSLDGDVTTIADSINPDLWYSLFTTTENAKSNSTTVDGYKAVIVNNTYYIAGTVMSDDETTITPYMFVLAYSANATAATNDVVAAIIEQFNFNVDDVDDDTDSSLITNCEANKKLLVKDTARVNDLGSMGYVLAQYYKQNGNYPTLDAGSYISGLTTSIWPSWNSTLGNALGQTLPNDSINVFADAEKNCPYHPPDLSDKDVNPSELDADGNPVYTYYDQSGTCWDPVNKDYKGPAGSYLYQYIYNATNSTYKLYTNLEYTGNGSWAKSVSDPCSYWKDSYSAQGCNTFNYIFDSVLTTSDYGSISQ